MNRIEKVHTAKIAGKELILFRLTNSQGCYVEITNYGATIVSVVIPDASGKRENVVLSYNHLPDYTNDSFYTGATIGRVANRLSKAQFMLNGQMYYVDKNDGNNSNHGGYRGFHQKTFDYTLENGQLCLHTTSPDGEGGFPGELDVCVIYSFSENNELCITYHTSTTKTTPVDLTNHVYFNLGAQKRSIGNDLLQINALQYLETDAEFIPTGQIHPTRGTAFDFNAYQKIKDMASLKNDYLKGYNTYFIRTEKDDEKPLASLKNELSGRVVDLYTSMPGVLIYTGDYLSDPFLPFGGICLEAQYYPDALNHPGFLSHILIPGTSSENFIRYHFRIG